MEIAGILASDFQDPMLLHVVEGIEASRNLDENEREVLLGGVDRFDRGIELYRSFDFAEAEPLFRTAAEALRLAGSPLFWWAEHFATVCLFFRDVEEASGIWASQIESIPREYLALEGHTLWRLGISAHVRGDPHASLEFYQRAVSPMKKSSGRRGAAFTYVMIADALEDLGRVDESWGNRLEAIEQIAYTRDVWQTHSMLFAMADALLRRDLPRRARPFLDALVANAHRWTQASVLDEALDLRARAAVAENRLEDARMDLEAAWSDLESHPEGPARDRSDQKLRVVEGLILAHDRPAEAVAVLEAAYKGMSDSGYLYEKRRVLKGLAAAYLGLDDVWGAEQSLLALIEDLERTRLGSVDLDLKSQAAQLAEPVVAGLRTLLQLGPQAVEVDRLLATSERARSAVLSDLAGIDASSIDLTHLRGRLAPDLAVLSYVLLEGLLLVEMTTSGGSQVLPVSMTPGRLAVLVSTLRDSMQAGASLAALQPYLEELFSLLLPPSLRPSLPDRLLFVPDGALMAVPFHGLRNPDTARYLVEDHQVGVLPNLSLLDARLNREPSGKASGILVVGDPATEQGLPRLPGAEREASLVSRMYDESILLLGDEATDQGVASGLGTVGVFHYSGHAVSDPRRLSAGGLILSEETGDGFLSTTDLAGLRLEQLDLAVLAGCETARGYEDGRDGLMGLGGVLLARGARSVLASVAAVRDGASETFVGSFHQHYLERQDALEAFRLAIGDALRNEKDESVSAVWMNYVLLGGV